MSDTAYFWAREVGKAHGLRSSLRFVLRELADHHNKITGQCNPSVVRISEYTGLDRKTVMAALGELEKLGLVSSVKKQGSRTSYSLHFELIQVNESGAENGTGTKKDTSPKTGTSTKKGTSTKSGHEAVPKTGQPPVPKTGHEPISKPIKESKPVYMRISIADLPTTIDTGTACEWIQHRANLKKPLTQKSFDRAMQKAVRISEDPEISLSANQIIETAIDKGWQGFENRYYKNLEVSHAAGQQSTRQDSSRGDTPSWFTDELASQCDAILQDGSANDCPNSGPGGFHGQ